jgi:hypothetical protein
MTLDYTLQSLQLVYGAENVVYWRVSDRVGITVEYPGEDKAISVTVTIEQAKYLATHPLSIQDLAAARFPNEWAVDEF